MSGLLYVVAIGVPVSGLICLLHALVTRRMDLVIGGTPVVMALGVLGLILVGLFG